MRLSALLVSVFGFSIVVGCGSIGEPLYPALNVPLRVTDLVALERGDKLEIHFTMPLRTTEGLVVKQIGSVEVRVGANDQPSFEINRWSASAKRVDAGELVLPGQSQGIEMGIRDSIGKDLIVAVRVANAKGRDSEWSNLVTVTIEPPLVTPSDFKAEDQPRGVSLTWSAPGIGDFRLYKKGPEQNAAVLLATVTSPTYLDTEVEFDKTYDYYVEAFRGKTTVSVIAGPAEVTPKDIFAPSVPAGLTASNGIAAIELAWERNTEPRFKEYRILRSEGSGPFAQIAAGLDVPSYSDHNVETGKHYRYRLVAVGQNGMASQPSEPIEAVAP